AKVYAKTAIAHDRHRSSKKHSTRIAILLIHMLVRGPVATISPNCYRTRRGFHLRRLQVTLSAAKLGARVGTVHEKARPGGICLCIDRRDRNADGIRRRGPARPARMKPSASTDCRGGEKMRRARISLLFLVV